MYNIVDAGDIKKDITEYEKLDKTIPIFDDAEYIIAECDGEKKGYIAVTEKGNKFILEKLFIKKEERYKAYGSKLVNFFINYARKSKKDVIIYEGEDKKIKSFLRKFGFKEIKGKFLIETVEKDSRKKEGAFVALGSVFLNIFLAGIKIFGGIKGKSNALVADGFNSLSDVVSSSAILLGIHFSNMPEDEDHPYGHEKIESIIGIMVGLFVVITAFEIGRGAVLDLLKGVPKTMPSFSTIYLALISAAVKYGMYFYKMKVGKATKNVALIADARDSKSDVFSSLGVIIGILLSIYVSPIFDTVVSLIVAALILKEGLSTIFETSNIILDKQEEDFIKEIEEYIYKNTDIKNVHEIYMRRSGDKIFLSFHIRLNKNTTVYKAHHISDALEQSIMMDFKEVKEVMIHVDYLMD